MKKRKEIRIVDPSKSVLDVVTKLAESEKRTIGKQAEYMIAKHLEEQKRK